MFNLLPYQEKNYVKGEYKRRLLVVAFTLLFITQGAGLALLFPAYILSNSRERELTDTLAGLKVKTNEEGGGSFSAFLKETTDKLSALSPDKNRAQAAQAIERAAAARVGGIHLKRFTYTFGKNYEIGEVRVDGVAETRDSLQLFKVALEKESLFTTVDLPVSSFTKDKDISFSVRLVAGFKKTTGTAGNK